MKPSTLILSSTLVSGNRVSRQAFEGPAGLDAKACRFHYTLAYIEKILK